MKIKFGLASQIFLGLCIGIVLEFLSFILSGFGHGIIVPSILTSGPIALLFPLAWLFPKTHNLFMFIAMAATPCLYAIYAFALYGPEKKRRRFLKIISIHMGSALLIVSGAIIYGSVLNGLQETVRHALRALILFVVVFGGVWISEAYFALKSHEEH
jgi:hypothetical protein